MLIMKKQFEAILTGTDMPIDGIVSTINFDGFENAYEFESIDNNPAPYYCKR